MSELLSKISYTNPPIVFFDSSSVQLGKEFVQLFCKDSNYYVPYVIIISDTLTKESLNIAYDNIIFTSIGNLCVTTQDCIQSLKSSPSIKGKGIDIGIEHSEKIMNYLLKLGFTHKHSGLILLKEVIKLAVANNGIISSLHNDYYPVLAQRFNCSVYCVERNIRNAIDYAWRNLNINEAEEDFHTPSCFFKQKPSNRKLIGFLTNMFLEQFVQEYKSVANGA